MEVESRRSRRQAEILLQLTVTPARTITELAGRVDASRPSVSRSLHALKNQGLVERDQRGWHLTNVGESEAISAGATLINKTDKTQNTAKRAGEALSRLATSGVAANLPSIANAFAIPNITNAIRPITFPVPNPLAIAARDLAGVGGISEMLANYSPTVASFSEVFEGMNFLKNYQPLSQFKILETPRMTGLLSNAIAPLLEAQERNRTLIYQLASSQHFLALEEVARQNNLFLAGAIDNVLTIHAADAMRFDAQFQKIYSAIDFSWISTRLESVHQAFMPVFHQHIEELWQSSRSAPLPLHIERVVVPPRTVGHYTRSLRTLVEAETDLDPQPLAEYGAEEFGDRTLDPLLHKLNPEFVEIRRASWWVLQQQGPDRLRHAGVSQRELLRQVLEFVVPGIQLPEDKKQGPQIKERAKDVLRGSDSDAEFIDALAKAVFSTYKQLNKFTHHNMKHEESLRALLRVGEGLLRFLLVNINLDD